MKEHPDIVKFCRFPAYVRTHSTGILRGLPLSTRTLEQSLVCYTLSGSRYARTQRLPPNAPYRGTIKFAQSDLDPAKQKGRIPSPTMIPCLCSFTVPSSPSAEPPINKKRTRTLSRKESGSSTNCLAEHQGVEPWHRSPGLSHFESLNRLDEAGFVRLSWAVVGIFCASQKWHIIAIYRRKSTTFCEVPLEKPPFTQSVRSCISGAVPLDVR